MEASHTLPFPHGPQYSNRTSDIKEVSETNLALFC